MYEDFIEKAGLTKASKETQGIAYQLLKGTCECNKLDSSQIHIPESVADDLPFQHLLNLAGSWSNDLMDVFVEYAERDGVDTPLIRENHEDGFQWLWHYLGL